MISDAFGGGFGGPCQGATFSKPKDERLDPAILPNTDGYFGDYGGAFLPPPLVPIIDEIKAKYNELKEDPSFWAELRLLEKHFTGRPSPILHCERLSEKIGGAQIYLKREDLNHTGAHKINHCLGEALLAEDGAGAEAVEEASVALLDDHAVDAEVVAQQHEEAVGHHAEARGESALAVLAAVVVVQRHLGEEEDRHRPVLQRLVVDPGARVRRPRRRRRLARIVGGVRPVVLARRELVTRV